MEGGGVTVLREKSEKGELDQQALSKLANKR